MVIDKDKFIKTYGINDDKFIEYLNKFGTLKKVVNMGRLDIIPKEKLNHLYNRYIYYNSLGHNLETIAEETLPYVRNLFFFGGNGYLEYKLPVADGIEFSKNASAVSISGRTCHVKIGLIVTKPVPQDTVIFELTPAPFSECRSPVIWTSNSDYVSLIADDNGIRLAQGNLAKDCTISGAFTYVIGK